MARRRGIAVALAVLSVCVAAPATAGAAATIAVNTEADNAAAAGECSGATGDCSIRQAIDKAASGDTVAIPPGNYALDELKGVLLIKADITVAGMGQPTIDGGGKVQVFQVGDNGSSPTVTISGVTITRGFTQGEGGGIDVFGVLTLIGSTVKDSTANDGGGIGTRFTEENFPTVRVVNSTISGNTAVLTGGGISLGVGALTVVNSTITGNTATGNGATDGRGGGIFTGSRARLFNVTIVGNTAQGAAGAGGNLYNDSPPVSKIQANARQVVAPAYSLRNTIVADGTAAGGPNCGG